METIKIRSFQEKDFSTVHRLNIREGWNRLVEHEKETFFSWINSDPALVATYANEVVGYLRGLTDGAVTLYICEILVKEEYRKHGIGEQLISRAHECYPSTRIEMLATSSSESYYSTQGYRPFFGFRKNPQSI